MIAKKNSETWWVAKSDSEILGVTSDLDRACEEVRRAFLDDNPDVDKEKISFDLRDRDYVLVYGPVPLREYVAERTELL